MKKIVLSLFIIPLTLLPNIISATPDRGTLLSMSCAACHGTDGKSPGAMPSLYGKSSKYIEIKFYSTWLISPTLTHFSTLQKKESFIFFVYLLICFLSFVFRRSEVDPSSFPGVSWSSKSPHCDRELFGWVEWNLLFSVMVFALSSNDAFLHLGWDPHSSILRDPDAVSIVSASSRDQEAIHIPQFADDVGASTVQVEG